MLEYDRGVDVGLLLSGLRAGHGLGRGLSGLSAGQYSVEEIQVVNSNIEPCGPSSVTIGGRFEALLELLIVEYVDDGVGERIWRLEVNQHPPAVGEYLFRIQVRGADNGFTAAHGVCQRATADLVLVQIRSDIHVRRAQIPHQLVEGQEPVVEPHLCL